MYVIFLAGLYMGLWWLPQWAPPCPVQYQWVILQWVNEVLIFGDKFGESLVGSQAPPSFWEVPGLPRKFPELPRKFSATSPEVLSLWNLTAIPGFPGSFPNFPGSSGNFPGSSGTSPEVSPFLWEAWHPLLTHENFLWHDDLWHESSINAYGRVSWVIHGWGHLLLGRSFWGHCKDKWMDKGYDM